ncbi:MAG: lysophospholipid acyltransferase family protein [bacterium]
MRRTLNAIGSLFASILFYFGIRRSVTFDNLQNAYPTSSKSALNALALNAYKNLGIVFAEMLYLRFARLTKIKRGISVSNPELFHAALAKKKGLIVVAGHYANWEWLALGGSLVLKTNYGVIRKNIDKSFVEKFLTKMRTRTGNRMINAGDVRGMYRALQSGECITILGDQAAPGESVRVPFFGREVPTFEGPARLAIRTNAIMLFAECFRKTDGNYEITFHPMETDDIVGDSELNVKILTVRHTEVLEKIIRLNPEQWLWQHKRWKYV